MSEDIIERVAKAIQVYGVRIWGVPHLYAVFKYDALDTPIKSGMSCEIALQEAAKLNARAALLALSEPTEEMIIAIEAKAEERYHAAPYMQRFYGEDIWRAAIDAALNGKGETK